MARLTATLLTLCLDVCALSFHLSSNVCKWCEMSSPHCEDSVCYSNCSLSSFCTSSEEICVAIWTKLNDTMSVQTMCHHPAQPLDGIEAGLLMNSSSRDCVMVAQPSQQGTMMACGCQGEHECNDKMLFDKGANGFSKLQSKDVIPVVVVSLVPPILVALIATLSFYLYRTHCPEKPGQPAHPDWPTARAPGQYQSLDIAGGRQRGAVVGPGRDECNTNMTSFTGNITEGGEMAEPLPIKLETLVGKGRFAEVWRARLLQGETGSVSSYQTVAVKVFPAMEYASWRNEYSIISDPKMEHDNVVRFLAAEERAPPGHAHRTYWLVLAYYSLGNLQDFLSSNILSWDELVAMAGSIAMGLAHLHSDTTPKGVPKVPVAHRDLKSSNIVVNSRRECALCDFGLALRLDLSLTVDDYANSGQVGTARYMAPEVLESRVNLEDLEAFKQMDVYSLALVLWEMASRCLAIGEVRSYEPAFGSRVCEQPCVDSMRDLVLRDRGRPDIPTAWTQHQGMGSLCSTIMECWDHDPEARLTAHCVVERFHTLEQEELLTQEETQQAEEACPEEERGETQEEEGVGEKREEEEEEEGRRKEEDHEVANDSCLASSPSSPNSTSSPCPPAHSTPSSSCSTSTLSAGRGNIQSACPEANSQTSHKSLLPGSSAV